MVFGSGKPNCTQPKINTTTTVLPPTGGEQTEQRRIIQLDIPDKRAHRRRLNYVFPARLIDLLVSMLMILFVYIFFLDTVYKLSDAWGHPHIVELDTCEI